MAEEAIRYKISADGAEQTARAFERVAGSQKVANDQFKQLSATASKSAQTFAALGGSLRAIVPEFGAVGMAVGRASGAISAMTGVLGGPWGIAIGAAIAGIGLLTDALKEEREETEKNIAKYADLAEARIADMRARAETRSNYAQGLRDAMQQAVEASGLDDQTESATFDSLVAALDKKGWIGENIEEKKGERRATYAELERRAATERQLEALSRMGREPGVDDRMSRIGRDLNRLDNGSAALDAKEAQNQAIIEQHRTFREQLLEEDRRYQEANAKLEEEAAKKRAQYQGVAIEAAQSFERVSIAGMQKIAKGQKFTVKELLSGIGDEMVAGGTKWIMEGTGRAIASYGTDPTAWGLIGLGSAEVGFGLMLGAATRPGSASGSGGGRGRQPLNPIGGGGNAGGGGSTTVIVNMPTVVSPGPQDGVRVQQALNEMNRAGLGRAA